VSDPDDLNAYQIAYVCGGPARVVMVALVGLYEDGDITIARARHRVMVRERDQHDPVRAAVVGLVPDAGRVLDTVSEAAARSEAVAGIRRTLHERGLLPPGSRITGPWPWPWRSPSPRARAARAGASRARAARRLRRRIVAGPPAGADDPRRVATMGPAGVGDPVLRRILQAPGPRTRPYAPR
jgi:hypothetical protein